MTEAEMDQLRVGDEVLLVSRHGYSTECSLAVVVRRTAKSVTVRTGEPETTVRYRDRSQYLVPVTPEYRHNVRVDNALRRAARICESKQAHWGVSLLRYNHGIPVEAVEALETFIRIMNGGEK